MSTSAAALAETTTDSGLTAGRLVEVLEPFNLVIERRHTIPELSCVRLWAGGGHLSICGTDLDVQLISRVPYDGVAFKTLVPFHSLLAALKSFAADAVPTFAAAVDKLTLSRGPTSLSIANHDIDNFAELTRQEPAAQFALESGVLLSRLDAVAPAICTEETRYYLNGVCLKHAADVLEFAATDGHRLHLAKAHLEQSWADTMPEVIVRRDAVRVLRKLLGAYEGPVDIEVSATRVAFLLGDDIWLETRTIDGTYPAYHRIIPEPQAKATLTFDVAEMRDVIAAVGRLASSRIPGARFCLSDCKVLYRDPNDGVTFERGFSGTIEGEPPPEIGLNYRIVADMLDVRKTGEAVAYIDGAAAPIRVEFKGDPTFVGVLMPMRL